MPIIGTPPPELPTVTVVVREVDSVKIHDYCSKGVACYDVQNNIITVPKIRGWWDSERLRYLGHEFYHAMGHRHTE